MQRATPSRYSLPRGPVAQSTSLPPAVGGLNGRDAISDMAPTDAVLLDDLFPQRNAVFLRKGWQQWVNDFADPVETLAPYNDVLGNSKLFAFHGTDVDDVSTQLAPAPETLPGAITSARWQYTGFTNAFNNFLVLVNGADDPLTYDGTTWANPTYTPEAGDTLDPADLISVIQHQRRLWFVESGSTSAWFGGVDEIQGTLTRFDFGELFPQGGYLMALGSWTVDNGQGVNDFLVAISSEGDVAVYEGYDPNSVDFVLVGRYRIGAPLGRRCMTRYIGDLLILTREGVVPCSTMISMREASEVTTYITDKIQALISNATAEYAAEFGWEMLYVPELNQLYVNVPDTSGQKQFVMNTITKAWCRFTGYPALCFALFDQQPFFGTSSGVGQGYSNYYDDYNPDTEEGTAVQGKAIQAFNYYGLPGRQKRFLLVRPVFIAAGTPSVQINVPVDFEYDEDELGLPPATGTPLVYLWDTAIWDAAYWSGSLTTFKRWFSANTLGFAGAVAIAVSAGQETQWAATDLVYEPGGVL